MTTISKSEWRSTAKAYRTGDPRKGTARVLRFVPGSGTCLVPVEVVPDGDPRLAERS